MGLNLSNRQIAQELSLNENDVQEMTMQLRDDFKSKSPDIVLSGEVEADEVYIVAGHKGNPAAVEKKGAKEGATVCAAHRGAARWKKRSRPFSV